MSLARSKNGDDICEDDNNRSAVGEGLEDVEGTEAVATEAETPFLSFHTF